MANPLQLPRLLVALCAVGMVISGIISLTLPWWKITTTATTSTSADLPAGSRASQSFYIQRVTYHSNLLVDPSISGTVYYSTVNPSPSSLISTFRAIIVLVIANVVIGALFVAAMIVSFSKFRAILHRFQVGNVLILLSVLSFIIAVVALSLISNIPSTVGDVYSTLYSDAVQSALPSYGCNGQFVLGSLQFAGTSQNCDTPWSTTAYGVSSSSASVSVAQTVSGGAGWWLNAAVAFSSFAMVILYIPGGQDLFLESVPTEEEIPLQGIARSDDQGEEKEEVELVQEIQPENAELQAKLDKQKGLQAKDSSGSVPEA